MYHTLQKFFVSILLFFVLLLLGGRALRANAPAPPCDQALPQPGCLYFPSVHYTTALITDTITYSDTAGLARTIAIAIRVPITAPIPLPVMIWSHGGATGHTDPVTSMAEWSVTTAEAGYLTISIAHTPRSNEERRLLCEAIAAVPDTQWDLGDPETCKNFKYLNWDRPHDIRTVLDEVERRNAQGNLQGRIDLAHMAVGGHSAGSSGALTIGGALRNFTGTAVDLSDPRPAAFLAFSPQQPGSEGFFDTDYQQPLHSWQPITRPVLMGTGEGDSTCNRDVEPGSCYGETPYGRRIAFERMPPGDKYRLYVHDTDTFHTLFALSTDNDKCGAGPAQQKCDEIARILRSSALAFLDRYLRNDPFAEDWLARDDMEIATNNVVEWSRK